MKKKLLSLLLLFSLLLTGCTIEIVPVGGPVSTGDQLTVHFIDVGQADSILLECDGSFMLIDGGNVDDGQLVVTYLQEQGVEQLQAVVCTHAHEDHVGGLSAVLAVFPTDMVLAPTTTYSSRCFDDFMYYVNQQDLEVKLPGTVEGFALGGANVTVLGPLKSYAETNDTSIICRVDYGENSFLFTGDMEVEAENDLMEAGVDLRADVLKVGHHGSNTSSGYRFLYEVNPTYGVISVGAGNTYGHPHEEPMSRLEQAGVTVLRTDTLGTVRAVSDGTDITFYWENQQESPLYAEKAQEQSYIGNKNSHTLHSPQCTSLPAEKNRVYFDSYLEAIESGYKPCSSCLGG